MQQPLYIELYDFAYFVLLLPLRFVQAQKGQQRH